MHMLIEHGDVQSEADLRTQSAKAVMKWLVDDILNSSALAADVF